MLITVENYRGCPVGGKAERLFELTEQGYPVPPFFCTDGTDETEDILAYIRENFSQTALFSVRSSASVEDGGAVSFAGQFSTFLNIPACKVPEKIQKVLAFSDNPNLRAYCRKQNVDMEKVRMTVIVQEMVAAERSGILFSANPQGLLNETVIVVGEGLGDKVVEDRTAVTTYYINVSDGNYYYTQAKVRETPLLTENERLELIRLSGQAEQSFGCHCDIEFAIAQGQLFLLQLRPITTLPGKGEGECVVLDNSNIVESYPGITLPLTQSFVREVYYKVFRSLLLRLTADRRVVDGMQDILQNMVDVANGRVYYRISNWYDVILLLPFRKKIIPVWQEMLGVSDRTVTSHNRAKAGFPVRSRVFFSFLYLLAATPKKMRALEKYFGTVLEKFRGLDLERTDNAGLLGYYRELEKQVTDKWDITLANDMYAFLFTALLKARLRKKGAAEYEPAANRYISRIADIESMKPVRALAALAKRAKNEGRLEELAALQSNEEAAAYFKRTDKDCQSSCFHGHEEESISFEQAMLRYIEQYGDRNLEELKLESKTFRTDPLLLVKKVLQYAGEEAEASGQQGQEKDEIPAGGLTGWLAKQAALGIRNRETSRMNRGRLYGMMRLLMLRIGENLEREGCLEKREDVFWLYLEELEAAPGDGKEGQEQSSLRELIERRKAEYAFYESLPAYGRLVFAGKVWNKTPGAVCGREKALAESGTAFRGLACSFGTAEGEVLIVEKPSLELDTRDKVLVTKMTDPGWVFLIADAKAVVTEKGSLLSHTAIVARELGKPAVVGVPHITERLKNGQRVRVDGDSGEVVAL